MAENDRQNKEEPIIIRRKKSSGHGGSHGGSWKVAYADFVTAMMAFFIVMWILGQSEQVKQQVVAYFKDPGAFNFVTGKRNIPVDLNLKPAGEGEGEGKTKDKKQDFVWGLQPDNKDSLSKQASDMIRKSAVNDSIHAAERVKSLAAQLKNLFDTQLTKNPEFKDLLSSIKIDMTPEGLRIELIESKESLFFQVGSSNVTEKAKEIISELAAEIGKLPNFVEIEGHTDSRAFKNKTFYSNWELSSERANAARKIVETHGIWQGQITRVTGFADKKLYNPENPFDFSNRRISFLIKQITLQEFMKSTIKNVKPA